jgi:NADH:ubiquinone oxidoreductase subunit 6 (subunit J)
LYDITIYILAITAIFEFAAIAFVFISKSLLHSVISLTLAFIVNSALFLVMGQPFLAIIQLFIFVGGISTYALVGVASSSFSKFPHTNKAAFVAVFVIFLAVISYPLLTANISSSGTSAFTPLQVKIGITNYMGLFYLITAMLFGVAISAIILFKSLGRLK